MEIEPIDVSDGDENLIGISLRAKKRLILRKYRITLSSAKKLKLVNPLES